MSETNLEFLPLDFFSSYATQQVEHSIQSTQSNHSILNQMSFNNNQLSESYHSDSFRINSNIKTQSSQNHNMVKQLIITMKQMVSKHIKDIGSTQTTTKIIKQIWNIFSNNKHPTKEILKALFEEEKDIKLLKKTGFELIVNKYELVQIYKATDQLKHEILFRMRQSCLKSHLMDRKIQKKDRLAAYIVYFMEQELKIGKISYRFGDQASRRINDILKKSQLEDAFIDEFLESREVFERFTSYKATF